MKSEAYLAAAAVNLKRLAAALALMFFFDLLAKPTVQPGKPAA